MCKKATLSCPSFIRKQKTHVCVFYSSLAWVAQLVEHFPEEEGVAGSSPAPSTTSLPSESFVVQALRPLTRASKCTHLEKDLQVRLIFAQPREVALRSSPTVLAKENEVGHTFRMHYVYILQDRGGKSYVGYSRNLKERLEAHRYKTVTTTRPYVSARLVWYCGFFDKKRAIDFERYLKVGSGHAFSRKHLVG